jgi:hypothetical protein
MSLLKLQVVFEGCLGLFTPVTGKACGCPAVQEDLRAAAGVSALTTVLRNKKAELFSSYQQPT